MPRILAGKSPSRILWGFLLIGIGMLPVIPETHASWILMIDGDARATDDDGDAMEAGLHAAGISLRKTLSNDSGDRLILFGLFEAYDDLSDRMLHEAYARYKGPLGRWNVTAGRFVLPFGLLTDFSTSRQLYDSLHNETLGMDVDSGIMLSGVIGDIDYGMAATQGYGGHRTPGADVPEIWSGRIGRTFGESGDIRAGISTFFGNTAVGAHEAHERHRKRRKLAAIDLTVQKGLWTGRVEVRGGTADGDQVIGGFGMTDIAVWPRLDLTLAAGFIDSHHDTTGYGHLGAGFRTPWFTLRGGYTYEHSDTDNHVVSFQIYRIFSLPF